MIASYPVVERRHRLVVGDITWDYIFLDEGHRLKNGKSKTSKILNAAQCAHKIVVTGTPVQNNISVSTV
jgi:SWI/SNF-related matrix-associated actin-dependent regulator of chromatin subfamily A protein 2/4